MDKLNIRYEMAQLDRKNRGFYDELTDEERKKFSLFLMIRWSSAVRASADLEEYYVRSANHFLNRHFFAINRHPRLQWLAATAVSPGSGTQDHIWIRPPQREKGGSQRRRALLELYPNMKQSDIDTLMHLVTDQDVRAYQRNLGDD